MRIENITEKDVEKFSEIGTASFIDDLFYETYKKRGAAGKTSLKSIFRKSIRICMEYGIAKKVSVNDEDCAFVLAFDYWEMKNQHTKLFNHFFYSNNRKDKKKLGLIRDSLENSMRTEYKYIYVLAIAVEKQYRNKGIATQLIKSVCDNSRNYGIIADVSNSIMVHIFESFEYEKTSSGIDGCFILSKIPTGLNCEIKSANNLIALPMDSKFFDGYKKVGTHVLSGVTAIKDHPFLFEVCNNKECEVEIYCLDRVSLLNMQSLIDFSKSIELCFDYNGTICLYYCEQSEMIHKKNNLATLTQLTATRVTTEDELITDIFTSIPMTYDDIEKFSNVEYNYYSARTIDALRFRTEYESGVPLYEDKASNFKNRIKRFNLGNVTFQLKAEKELHFGQSSVPEIIGDSGEALLVLSLDISSKICVLHLITFSFGNKITQYLDCVSRNQIEIISKNGPRNLYEYLAETYGLTKVGSAKNFITIFENKEDVDARLLSSILFCETYYEHGTGLSTIIDKDILSMVNSTHGVSQYDYADVLINSNVVVQLSAQLFNTIETRIIHNSTTLFYIELVVFEEAALRLADIKIKDVLSTITEATPNSVLKQYGQQLREYASTIDFWDIQMNYPSSKLAVDNNRKYFGIEKMFSQYKRDQEVFQKIYEAKSDYADRIESTILTTIGAGLTTISVLQLLWRTTNINLVLTATSIVTVLYILKRKLLLRDRKKDKSKKKK